MNRSVRERIIAMLEEAEFYKNQDYRSIKLLGRYKDYDVYTPEFVEEMTIGFPILFLVRGDSVEEADFTQCFDVMDGFEQL